MSLFSPSNQATNSTQNNTYGLQGTFSTSADNSSSPVLTLNFGSGTVSGSTSANPSTSQPTSYTPLANTNSGGASSSSTTLIYIVLFLIIAGVAIYFLKYHKSKKEVK